MKKTRRQKFAEIVAAVYSLALSTVLLVLLHFASPVSGSGRYLLVYLLPLAALVLFYLYFTRKYRKRSKILQQDFPVSWRQTLASRVAYYAALDEKGKKEFETKVQLFLGEKVITPIDTEIDDEVRVLIAASAVIPVFRLPDWEYDKIYEILVYPGNFNDEFETEGSEDSNIMGMVIHNSSTVLFSKQSLLYGFQNTKDKQNVGIHEFIHKIDEVDGCIDGIPAMHIDRKDIGRWLELVEEEQNAIRNRNSDINPYALTNNAEFFAVASEYLFENPEAMKRKHEELYLFLERIFRQDTLSLLKDAAVSLLKRPKKIGRNSPCPCGSGKKYKKCCMNKKRG